EAFGLPGEDCRFVSRLQDYEIFLAHDVVTEAESDLAPIALPSLPVEPFRSAITEVALLHRNRRVVAGRPEDRLHSSRPAGSRDAGLVHQSAASQFSQPAAVKQGGEHARGRTSASSAPWRLSISPSAKRRSSKDGS